MSEDEKSDKLFRGHPLAKFLRDLDPSKGLVWDNGLRSDLVRLENGRLVVTPGLEDFADTLSGCYFSIANGVRFNLTVPLDEGKKVKLAIKPYDEWDGPSYIETEAEISSTHAMTLPYEGREKKELEQAIDANVAGKSSILSIASTSRENLGVTWEVKDDYVTRTVLEIRNPNPNILSLSYHADGRAAKEGMNRVVAVVNALLGWISKPELKPYLLSESELTETQRLAEEFLTQAEQVYLKYTAGKSPMAGWHWVMFPDANFIGRDGRKYKIYGGGGSAFDPTQKYDLHVRAIESLDPENNEKMTIQATKYSGGARTPVSMIKIEYPDGGTAFIGKHINPGNSLIDPEGGEWIDVQQAIIPKGKNPIEDIKATIEVLKKA